VVSLLTPEEIAELDLAQEAELSQASGLRFLSFPIIDRGVPTSRRTTLNLLRGLEAALAEGKGVAVHCRQGIGRSALIAACLLTLSGVDANAALQAVTAARGCPVPETVEQKEWIAEFAQALVSPIKKG
jgi:protein-tyrosine phosphatase